MMRAQTGPTAPFVTFENRGSARRRKRGASPRTSAKGVPHLVTREPGGTPFGRGTGALVLVPRKETILPKAKLLLYEAARAPSRARGLILPTLLSGRAVLCDRFCDATTAYPGAPAGDRRSPGGAAETVPPGGSYPP